MKPFIAPNLKLWMFLGAFLGVSENLEAQDGCYLDHLSLVGESRTVDFTVELATEPAQHARGLMHRRSLDASAGMLFVFERPRKVTFWMKNTFIPLDMLFADREGVIRHIHKEAIPHDETPISGGDGIYAVLEINGGLSKAHEFKEGDVLKHSVFVNGSGCEISNNLTIEQGNLAKTRGEGL